MSIRDSLHRMVGGIQVPIHFFSKKHTEPQRRYSTSDRDLLVTSLFVLDFKPFVEGRDITLFKDHIPLVAAFYNGLLL